MMYSLIWYISLEFSISNLESFMKFSLNNTTQRILDHYQLSVAKHKKISFRDLWIYFFFLQSLDKGSCIKDVRKI